MLPVGPAGFGYSPYQPFSAFAGNELLVSLDALVEDGWLARTDLAAAPAFPPGKIDYPEVLKFKRRTLEKAFEEFSKAWKTNGEFEAFQTAEADWLDDYVLF